MHANPAPDVHHLVAEVFDASSPALRARLLECLVKPLRPLGLAAVAAGAFGGFLYREHWTRFSVPLEEAMRYTSGQVLELTRFVEQVSPETLGQIASLLAENPVGLSTFSGSLLLLTLRQWRRCDDARQC